MTTLVVHKTAGGTTGNMLQPQAENYLLNIIPAGERGMRKPNLTQALNDAFSGKGKATGGYMHNGAPVLHASAGDGASSVSLFYYLLGTTINLFAMGEHANKKRSTRYEISFFGPATGDFKAGRIVAL